MKECGLYDVVGVCDITEARRGMAISEGLKATGSFDELLGWDIELVLITSHSSAHYEDALKVAAARKHIFVEKPMALTGDEAAEMVRAAKDNEVMLTAHHNRHFDADYRRVKKSVLEEKRIGEIVSIENRTLGARPAVRVGVPEFNPEWRITAASGGGTLFDFGPHWVEQILDLMAGHKIVSVFGDVRHVKWGDAEDVFDLSMVFDNGVLARAAKADISYYSLPYKWLILGTEATLVADRGRDKPELTIYGEDSKETFSDAVEAHSLHTNIAEHLREGKDLIITAEHALRVMQVLQAGRDSAATGKSVEVEI